MNDLVFPLFCWKDGAHHSPIFSQNKSWNKTGSHIFPNTSHMYDVMVGESYCYGCQV